MHKNNMKKLKSAVISSVLAVSAMAAPFSTAVMNTSAASDNYAKLLQYSLYFYDANMCGDEVGQKSALSWRDNCHTGDEVTGGFHDAGDHAMFGLPQGYTASALGWSYYEFKDAFNSTGQAEHLKLITDHFCEFFKKSTKLNGDTVSSFLYQKEDGDKDHAYWGTPENQENVQGRRKMYWTSSGASDIAADYAAALAINYINFGNAEDLKYAEALYKFSTQYNQCATDGPTGFYSSDDCRDEQANAAGWLYLATKNESYKNDCASKQVQYLGWVDGWNNRDLGAACVYSHITGDWSKVTSFLQQFSAEKTQNGYFFADKWGSARINASMQFTTLVATKNSNADFLDWTKGQMDYLTGSNPTNTCFIVGLESNSAKNPHHRAASGYKSYDEFDGEHTTTHSPNGHSLVGALVGGPLDSSGTYTDSMADYVANEVALDYNAGLVGAAAGLYEMTKSGSTVSSIEGVTKIYSGSISNTNTTTTQSPVTNTTTTASSPIFTNTTTTTTTQNPSQGGQDITLTPSDMTVGTEKGDDGEMNNYAEFKPQGAKSVTLYYKVNSNDTETSGAFGTWTGEWNQTDFDKVAVPASKVVAVDYTIPSNVGQTVKAMVFWPHGNSVTIEKVVLHMGGSSTPTTTTTAYTPSYTTTTTAYTPSYTTTTTVQNPSQGGQDITLNLSDMTVGTEKGDDGEMNNYAEFKPQGAKSATLYYKVNSNDTETSGAFGTWTGKWEQTDFDKVAVPASKVVAVDYTIPSNVGQTVKAMVFWPHGDSVTIEKVVLHMDGSSNPTTTTTTTTRQTTTTTTTRPIQSGSVRYGDANEDGKVSLADAVLIMQALSNPNEYKISAQGKLNADVVDGDGLTPADALAIQAVDLKILNENQLPVTSATLNNAF